MEDMMPYCAPNILKTKFMNLHKTELDDTEAFLESRFQLATTVKGTGVFHHFMPLSATRLGAKQISNDDQFTLKVDLIPQPNSINSLQIAMQNKFVCAAYDPKWDTRIVTEIDEETEDGLVNFMYPKRPISFFHWPFEQDFWLIPLQHIMCNIDVPCLVVNNRGQYDITNESKVIIGELWKKFLQR